MAKRARLASGLWRFMKQNKVYWMAPILLVLLLLVLLECLGSSAAPFSYTLF